MLTYGGYEPRKNFDRLIEAHLASGMDIPLIRTGPGDLEGAAGRLLKSAGKLRNGRPRVRQLGYVGAGQLVDLIRGAACVAYPSQYEGFGLPIVEGFRCGTPVLTSNSNSMVEVAGDAAHLVDPYSVSDIRDGLVKICGDAALRGRAGPPRARAFQALHAGGGGGASGRGVREAGHSRGVAAGGLAAGTGVRLRSSVGHIGATHGRTRCPGMVVCRKRPIYTHWSGGEQESVPRGRTGGSCRHAWTSRSGGVSRSHRAAAAGPLRADALIPPPPSAIRSKRDPRP